MVALVLPASVGGTAAAATTPTFVDIAGSPHSKAITRLAAAGVTKGCNPPKNTRFCPNQPVTRAEMATFLVRALRMFRSQNPVPFVDVVGSPHANNIATIAELGVTTGCNPPQNHMYCPDRAVTRAEMATFLVRALKLPKKGGIDPFVDVSRSRHTGAIATIAAAGISKGCNPPKNDRFCPDDPVTRGEMATFLVRAIPRLGMVPPTSTTTTTTAPTVTATTTPAEDTTVLVPAEVETIQGAINLAEDGWRVLVAPGTYHENIDFKGKVVEVRSLGGPQLTTIHGVGGAPVADIVSPNAGTILDGFTITGGLNTTGPGPADGGGVRIIGDPTVRNLVLTGNDAQRGDGIWLAGSPRLNNITSIGDEILIQGPASDPIVENLKITGAGNSNTPALEIAGANVTLIGAQITQSEGAAIRSSGALELINSVVVGHKGDALWSIGSLTARHVTLVAGQRSALRIQEEPVVIVDSIIVGSAGHSTVDCTQAPINQFPDITFVRTLLSSDPGFDLAGFCTSAVWGPNPPIVAPVDFLDQASGDLRPAPGSKAIDAALPNDPLITDIAGVSRKDGNADGTPVADLGAYEAPTRTSWPGTESSVQPAFEGTTDHPTPDITFTAIDARDMTGDGVIDVVALGYEEDATSRSIYIYPGLGNRDFDSPLVTPAGRVADSLGTGDLDGDGWLDVAVAADTVRIFRGLGDGTFDPAPLTVGEGDPRGVWVGDLDADDDDDLVLSVFHGFEVLTQEDGSLGSFATAANSDSQRFVTAADLTGGDILDLVGWGFYQPFNGTAWGAAIDLGTPFWMSSITPTRLGTSSQPVVVAVQDSQTDLLQVIDVVTLSSYTKPLYSGPNDSAAADLTGDGLNDIVVLQPTGAYPAVGLLRADASGILGSEDLYPIGPQGNASILYYDLAVADLDSDGRLDVLAAGAGGFASLWGAA